MAQSRIKCAALLADVNSETKNNRLRQICRDLPGKQRSMDDMAYLAGVRSLEVLMMVPEFCGRQRQENGNRQASNHALADVGAK